MAETVDRSPLHGDGARPLDALDTDQRQAASLPAPLLVLAGPGAGKTTLLVTRARARLAEGRAPLLVCFSRRAADELRRRLGRGLPASTARTSHALAFWLLRRFGPPALPGGTPFADVAILPPRQAEQLQLDVCHGAPERLLALRSALRRGAWPDRPPAGPAAADLAAYLARLARLGALDFDALLAAACARLRQAPALAARLADGWSEVLVDEIQDLAPAQLELVWRLAGGRVVLVGDPWQSIFRWRDADPAPLARLAARLPRVVLRANFRSARAVLATANTLALALARRARGETPELATLFPDRVQTARCAGGLVRTLPPARRTLARGVAAALALADPADSLVLCRTRREVWSVALALARAGVPFRLLGLPRERVARLARLRPLGRWLLADPAAPPAAARRRFAPPDAALSPPLALALLGLDRLGAPPAAATPAQAVDACLAAAGWQPDGLALATVHGAKGLEADVVLLSPSVVADRSFDALAVSYVAATRARAALLVAVPPDPGKVWQAALACGERAA